MTSRLLEAARTTLGWLKRHKRAVQAVTVAVIGLFLARSLATGWASLRGYAWQVRWYLLLLALLLFVAQELSFALVWRAILARMGFHLRPLTAQRIYLGSEMVRYIPGNIWHVIMRVVWAERHGVPKAAGFASMVLELATKIAAGAVVFAASLLFWPDAHVLASMLPHQALLGAGILGVPLLLVGLHPRVMSQALDRALGLLGRQPVVIQLSYADVLLVAGLWCASWVLGGLGFWLLLAALAPVSLPAYAPVLATGIFALAWDIGFLSFITPSGLGFREAAVVSLLVASGLVPVGPAGVALATVAALLSRLLTTVAEMLCILGAHVAGGRDMLPAEATERI